MTSHLSKHFGEKLRVSKVVTASFILLAPLWVGCQHDLAVAQQNNGLIADGPGKTLRLWYDEPAPDSDAGWVKRSIPMGNGYMGINVFGGTASERIQITENSLYSGGREVAQT
ncbi:glycoside hydrolase N-terminal domain-containing protein [Adhaeretor mobilis]|uniref:Glycosyl hydrolase family 95 N-terminal domain-containing protein n=1 Tax=Adhaeretor mobilis TaxID=1930276 RepID=A0A517MX40_9BACT|nr:glycoside hydrolase N-terminal domain-containing protein [Adhaeretor mobilis]QDS99448.1 hypothetical protein HG15A2_27710 [Adhaeretor mobilis]